MKLKIFASVLLISAAAGVLAFQTYHTSDKGPLNKDRAVVALVGQILKEGHYHPKDINNSFSEEVFYKYLNDLDGEKKFFIQPDIQYLDRYKDQVDDEINAGGRLDFWHDADSIFDLRVNEAEVLYPKILADPFNFSLNQKYQLERDSANYPTSEQDLKDTWKKMLKYRTLDKVVELQDLEKSSKDSVQKTMAQLEKDAREKMKITYTRYFDRLHNSLDSNTRFSLFVNAITTSMDPHTDYMSPLERRSFDEQMSGTFYGIGALLKQDDGKVKIESVVTGGPAWKEGELKAGDVILKVAQGDKEPVDLTGYTTEDAVKIIRGSKGTIVKLTVKQLDGTLKTVAIKRDEVKIEDTFAHSYIINNGKHKIGYIFLPEFYASFNQKNGRRSAVDVEKEIDKLKAVNVDGIILDLRFNGGGSLADAIDMAGLFIPQGPIVQVRSRNGSVSVLKDRNPQVSYSGPLAIMVNEYSASASEILTAALQDYKRAVVIGSNSTYGKGSVQRMFDLGDFLSPSSKDKFGDLGAIKLTIQKFYRIDGGSTQLKGVTPDIILPDAYYDVAERNDSDALKWDEIPKADYNIWKNPVNVSLLRKKSEQRVNNNKAFKLVKKNIQALRDIRQQQYVPLDISDFKSLQQSNDSSLKKIDEVDQYVNKLKINNLAVDLPALNKDSSRLGRNKDMMKRLSKDVYLDETVNVVDDMIDLPNANVQTKKLADHASQ